MERYFVYNITAENKTQKEQMISPEVEKLRGGLVECPLTALLSHFKAIVENANKKYHVGKELIVQLTGTGDGGNKFLRIVAKDEYKSRFLIVLVPVKTVVREL